MPYSSISNQVFDYTRCTLQTSWEGHQSWVRDLQWCQNSPFFQLVSVGDRIAWWEITSARVNNMSTSTLRTPAHSARNGSHSTAGLAFPLSSVTPRSSSSSSVSSLRYSSTGLPQSPELHKLVQTVEFQTRGRYASKIFVSDDGRSLVTVSDSGILYILHQLNHD